MPKGIAANAAPAPAGKRNLLAAVGIPLLIVGTAAASFAWNALQIRNTLPRGGIVNTGGGEQEQFWSLFTTTARPVITETPTQVVPPPLANCPLPEGWTPYIVAPTDSLYRLAIVYGVSVEDLQRVNCMGDATTILPGQVIYVPLLPTPTPSFTPTTPQVAPIVVSTAVTTGGGGEKPKPSNPTPRPTRRPPTATAVPPTEVPTTAVPPTEVPPTAIPPTPIPPTAIPIVETAVPTPNPTKTPKPKPTKKPKGDGSAGLITLDGSGSIIDQIQGIFD